MSDQQVFVVTDPAEGPKAFRVQTRVTSRGEMAVILMGVDCAERVMCHESVSFILAEGEFVFKVTKGTGGGAMKVTTKLTRRKRDWAIERASIPVAQFRRRAASRMSVRMCVCLRVWCVPSPSTSKRAHTTSTKLPRRLRPLRRPIVNANTTLARLLFRSPRALVLSCPHPRPFTTNPLHSETQALNPNP